MQLCIHTYHLSNNGTDLESYWSILFGMPNLLAWLLVADPFLSTLPSHAHCWSLYHLPSLAAVQVERRCQGMRNDLQAYSLSHSNLPFLLSSLSLSSLPPPSLLPPPLTPPLLPPTGCSWDISAAPGASIRSSSNLPDP